MTREPLAGLFKKTFRDKYGAMSAKDILAASPGILKGVSRKNASAWARRYRINTIADLIDRGAIMRDKGVDIDPRVLGSLAYALGPGPGFDPGPPRPWEQLLIQAPLDAYATHKSGRFRTKFGPVLYRGRLDGTARVLIVGQDPSTDEILAHRILVGDAGQRLQRLLNKLGLTCSYVMLNTFLFGIEGQFDEQMKAIALEAPILDYRNMLFDRLASENRLEAVFAFGQAARFALDSWPGKTSYRALEFAHPSASDSYVAQSWNSQLSPAHALVMPDADGQVDLAPYGAPFTAADRADIPRRDLPFGIPAWHGTHGTRSHRNGAGEIAWDAV